MPKTIVMSLGGSLIAPDKIDLEFLKRFKQLVLKFSKKNRIVIICGGGDTAREYQAAAKKINSKVADKDLDWIGIGATRINGELVSAIFGNHAHESILGDPAKPKKSSKRIIIGAGWLPGHSSDKIAVQAAKTFGAKTVINLSNITYVFDKDPSKHKDAKPQEKMDWKSFRKLVGDKWIPGAHVPFDPVASKLAQKYKMQLVVMNGSNLKNLSNFLDGKKFIGTIIE
ncbi:MAG: UMP kinase [Candidatus Buchananbacteria bacterium]|nr:UMP kinase [Candidatus Buchananbacteria bacterium]